MSDAATVNSECIDQIKEWLLSRVADLSYGRVELILHIHNGAITRIEKGVSESTAIVSKKENADRSV